MFENVLLALPFRPDKHEGQSPHLKCGSVVSLWPFSGKQTAADDGLRLLDVLPKAAATVQATFLQVHNLQVLLCQGNRGMGGCGGIR